ncbi:hypothetical protein THASP1DRAFT_28445 [Thamnocephalis sphaerospora]|uniref:Uncharacterized protein n=1 Tax=Thamnocephalis sphaerospora TaxID=78915 RepID=A0A4P9XWF8_9FUNG|nr:hypothetical protein THASP1DRAFT_28445 [Thamnocephalis sphaerospora]|eukprot:RKP09760.1 hypothetical protein THASP1DRAFT_28445 [Thamnocephalis sphaerospora]
MLRKLTGSSKKQPRPIVVHPLPPAETLPPILASAPANGNVARSFPRSPPAPMHITHSDASAPPAHFNLAKARTAPAPVGSVRAAPSGSLVEAKSPPPPPPAMTAAEKRQSQLVNRYQQALRDSSDAGDSRPHMYANLNFEYPKRSASPLTEEGFAMSSKPAPRSALTGQASLPDLGRHTPSSSSGANSAVSMPVMARGQKSPSPSQDERGHRSAHGSRGSLSSLADLEVSLHSIVESHRKQPMPPLPTHLISPRNNPDAQPDELSHAGLPRSVSQPHLVLPDRKDSGDSASTLSVGEAEATRSHTRRTPSFVPPPPPLQSPPIHLQKQASSNSFTARSNVNSPLPPLTLSPTHAASPRLPSSPRQLAPSPIPPLVPAVLAPPPPKPLVSSASPVPPMSPPPPMSPMTPTQTGMSGGVAATRPLASAAQTIQQASVAQRRGVVSPAPSAPAHMLRKTSETSSPPQSLPQSRKGSQATINLAMAAAGGDNSTVSQHAIMRVLTDTKAYKILPPTEFNKLFDASIGDSELDGADRRLT